MRFTEQVDTMNSLSVLSRHRSVGLVHDKNCNWTGYIFIKKKALQIQILQSLSEALFRYCLRN